MDTLHCVNKCKKMRHYRARSAEERRKKKIKKKKNAKSRKKITSHGAYVHLRSDVKHSFNWKSAIKHNGCVLK